MKTENLKNLKNPLKLVFFQCFFLGGFFKCQPWIQRHLKAKIILNHTTRWPILKHSCDDRLLRSLVRGQFDQCRGFGESNNYVPIYFYSETKHSSQKTKLKNLCTLVCMLHVPLFTHTIRVNIIFSTIVFFPLGYQTLLFFPQGYQRSSDKTLAAVLIRWVTAAKWCAKILHRSFASLSEASLIAVRVSTRPANVVPP